MNEDKTPIVKPKETKFSETTENYLKRILWLSIGENSAKISDIAKLMNRSLSSTTEAMQRLKEQKFITREKYGEITLTDKGREIANKINYNYKIIGSLLELLGLPKIIAHEDACSMEHAISNKTVKTLERFIEFMEKDPVNKAVIGKFKRKNS